MNYWVENYLLCLLVSVLLSGLIIPKILLIAFRKNLFDEVDERKIHRGVVPRLGGIAFLPSMVFSFCLIVGINLLFNSQCMTSGLVPTMVPIFFLVCSMMLMYLVGMADDLIGVRYRAKFLFQITASVLIVISGMWIKDLYGFAWIHEWPIWIGGIVSVILIVYVTNAINLIDGIDGLASGLSAIALGFYSYVFFMAGQYVYALIAGTALGTLIPFFYFNVFGHAERHTKIFMGDTGSLTIGFTLSFLTIAVFNIPKEDVITGENTFILAFAPILLPCFDVVRVFLHRVRRGANPFLPDNCHIHHKLLAQGCVQWQALITILITDAIFIICNLMLSAVMQPTLLFLGDLFVWTTLNILLTHSIRRREKAIGKKLYK